jgi:hypothetical protein
MPTLNHQKAITDFETGEVKSVNDNFIQFYMDNIDLVTEMVGENPTAAKIFLWLTKHMDKRGALVVSQQALADALGLHRNTVGNCTSYLKEKKALAVFKSGSTNVYAVNAQIAWKSDVPSKEYAWFDAKVYISKAEQDEHKPLFNTQLVGHAVKKKTSTRKRQKQLDKVIGLGVPTIMLTVGIFSLSQIFI